MPESIARARSTNQPHEQLAQGSRAIRITAASAIAVSVPVVRPCAWSKGTGFGVTRTIVRIGTDAGLEGLGECEGDAPVKLIANDLAPRLKGLAITDIAAVHRMCHMDFHDYGSLANMALLNAYAAVEMAMWDLLGKATGLPVYQLLGGAFHDRASFGAYRYTVHLETAGVREQEVPERMAKMAREAVDATGSTMFEFKVARYSPATDIQTIRMVRATLGDDIEIGVDANMNYDIDSARRVLRAVRDANLSWVEEPVGSMHEMQRLHAEFGSPISTHCTDPEKLNYFPGIEGVVANLHLQGGLLGTARCAAGIRAIGRRCWLRSCLELGISWAAMVHLALACPDLTRTSQCLIDYVEDDLILGETWHLRDGGVAPPQGPGLGVTLDEDAFARYAQAYRERGAAGYFDAA